ncbi:MAG: hypothetical protein RLO81_04155 [Fulvivirga sp.]|uniref:hypothetical protein n=1 Tax=Fulvivirga sp. TaxID=1931237 RepID=UPI0032EDDDEB
MFNKIKAILPSLSPERIKNLRVISLCVLAAGTFWFLNALNDSYSTTFRYPITFVYDNDKYIAINEPPSDVQINISGVGWNLFRNNLGIKTTPVTIRLDNPTEVKKLPGSSLLGTITDQLAEFDVNFVLTDTLYLNIDKRISKRFSLKVDSGSLQLSDNFWVTSPIISTPDSITLQGPASLLNKMPEPLLVKVPQDDIDENFNEEIPVEIEHNRLISRNPPTMGIAFSVEEYQEITKDIPISPVNFPVDSSKYLQSPTVPLKYRVSISKEPEISLSDFKVKADLKLMNPKDSLTSLQLLSFPSFIRDVKLERDSAKVVFNER